MKEIHVQYIEMSQTLLQLVNHRFLNIIYYDNLYVIISIPGQRRVRSASIYINEIHLEFVGSCMCVWVYYRVT